MFWQLLSQNMTSKPIKHSPLETKWQRSSPLRETSISHIGQIKNRHRISNYRVKQLFHIVKSEFKINKLKEL